GLRVLLRRDLEETFSESQVRLWPGRNHHEVLRVVNLRVDRERHEAEEKFPTFHDQRHCWCHGVISVAADHDIDLLDVEQMLVNAGDELGVRLIVDADELHRPAEELTVGIDVLLPDLVGESSCLAVRCESARERQTISDSEWRSIHDLWLRTDEVDQAADDR